MNQPVLKSSIQQKTRLLSIDALRGFDMFWILGAEGVFAILYKLSGWTMFLWLSQHMVHSEWHGLTAYDLIFPLFIFLSGVSLGFASKPIQVLSTVARKQRYRQAVKRLLLLVLLGVVYNHGWGTGIPADPEQIRFASVLGRIGIAWFVAAMIVWHCQRHIQWLLTSVILLAYWGILAWLELGGYGGAYDSDKSINIWFDQHFLPGIHYQNQLMDPEGLLSNIPSIANALLGAFIGQFLAKHQHNWRLMLSRLVIAGLLSLLLGYAWAAVMPINKSLWTSSFVLVTTGYSLLLLTLFILLCDVLNWRRFALFFAVIGMNSVVIYLATSLVNFPYTTQSLLGGIAQSLPSAWGALLLLVVTVVLQWLVAYWLYQRKIFIKL